MTAVSLRQRRRRAALYSAGAVSVAGLLLAYRYYQSPKAEGEPELSYLQRLKLALKKYSDAFLLGGDLVSGILRDLHSFVQSDSSELPQSIRQVARLLQSREVAQSTSALTAAVFRGIVDPHQNNPERTVQASDRLQQGAATATGQTAGQASGLGGLGSSLTSSLFPALVSSRAHEEEASGRLQESVADAVSNPDAAERILNALTSNRGKDLVSLVVSVAVRTSTREVCRCYERLSQRPAQGGDSSSNADPMDKVLSFAASDRGEKLATACISAMATQAMTVYMQKMEGIDTWDDLLRSMCKEQHTEFIQQMVRASIREGVYAAFGREPPHLAQRSQPTVHIAPASSSSGSPAASPRTPDAAAARESAQRRSSSSSSDPGHDRADPELTSSRHLEHHSNANMPVEGLEIASSSQPMSTSTPGYLAGGPETRWKEGAAHADGHGSI
ncbi:hypothetical protein WJX84_001042 [Apatococcus fuscideae]|uniref:Uncharacterized protein n=1 Tax=Apatococcus fuscideae TaxID=2026836 RepID=A0AAW1SWT2_9CHLO